MKSASDCRFARRSDRRGGVPNLDTTGKSPGLRFLSKRGILTAARRAGPTPKGGQPMSVLETLALLTLVIAAVSLGYQIKK